MKKSLSVDVFEAALERVRFCYDNFDHVSVSFSGGKDSGVLLNLAIKVAEEKGKLPVTAMFIDLEGQYKRTEDYVLRVAVDPRVHLIWICLPLHLRNAVSQMDPFWYCWDPEKESVWVRKKPQFDGVLDVSNAPPFFRPGMEFEEFVPEFQQFRANLLGGRHVSLVGIRTDESLNRLRTIIRQDKRMFNNKQWTTQVSDSVWSAFPIYDWKTRDIWRANGKNKWDYNKTYDLMQQAGMPLAKMRLCQPFGDDQRTGLWLFKVLESETWARLTVRVAGANFGSRHSNNALVGHRTVVLPDGFTWKSYTELLLSTMPPNLAKHYTTKIKKFIKWWEDHDPEGLYVSGIPDEADPKLESNRKVPSWRRVAKTLLKNDYWCKSLSFAQTKSKSIKLFNTLSKINTSSKTVRDT